MTHLKNKPELSSLVNFPVRVYWNSHRKLFSVQVQNGSSWYVAGHSANVQLINTQFKVSAAGHKRMLREKVKNVHAFVCGTLIGVGEVDVPKEKMDILNNPYKVRCVFYSRQDGCFATRIGMDIWAVISSPQVWLTRDDQFAPRIDAWNVYTNLDELYKTL